MSDGLESRISRCLPLVAQIAKYGVIGAAMTVLQTVVFLCLASGPLPCLAPGDWAVKLFGLSSAIVSDEVRAWHFAAATAVGFVSSNIPCWALNRIFVFGRGRRHPLVELGMFLSVSGFAMLLATALSAMMIRLFGMMTAVAVVLEILFSFAFNFAIRKAVIFRR